MCQDGMGRVGYVPSLLCVELTRHQVKCRIQDRELAS